MNNWENGLSPIARERLARIGEATPEERQKILDSDKVDFLLSAFYRGEIDSEGLWKRLREEGKPSLLREAQLKLIDSLSFGTAAADLERKKNAILAIESLKEARDTSTVEANLNRLKDLQKTYKAEIDRAYDGMKAEVERNPRLRVKQVQQGQSTMVVQLTVDEAIKQIPQWRDFLANQEKRYSQEFAKIIDRLRRGVR